ncbi:hypothetical protein AAVH_42976 [Aphelenchoides avenae]|nr:hypothetical protein AAVH_42976 [Aphelenchus avenae]
MYADNYERIGCTIGCAITAISWAAVLGWTAYAFVGEDFSSKITDCVFSQRTQSAMDTSLTICLFIDFIISVCDFGLITVNTKQLKRRLPNYSLRRSYQLKENRITTRIIFPCSLLHTLLFSVYLGTYGNVYRFVDALLNRTLIIECTHFAMSAYMCLSLTFFYYIRWKISICSSEYIVPNQSVDAYFESFERQIAFKPLERNV